MFVIFFLKNLFFNIYPVIKKLIVPSNKMKDTSLFPLEREFKSGVKFA